MADEYQWPPMDESQFRLTQVVLRRPGVDGCLNVSVMQGQRIADELLRLRDLRSAMVGMAQRADGGDYESTADWRREVEAVAKDCGWDGAREHVCMECGDPVLPGGSCDCGTVDPRKSR